MDANSRKWGMSGEWWRNGGEVGVVGRGCIPGGIGQPASRERLAYTDPEVNAARKGAKIAKNPF